MGDSDGGARKGGAYAAADAAADTADAVSRRVAHDLRQQVRRLGHWPVLSAEWVTMADAVDHLGRVASVEAADDAGGPTAYGDGDGGGSRGTAWTRDELCVRFVLEEGKTNLLLRSLVSLHEYKAKRAAEGTAAAAESEVPLRRFETGVGGLFRCLLAVEEAVQTLDMLQLVDYCVAAVAAAADAGPTSPAAAARMQCVLSVQYICLLLQQVDRLGTNEEKVLSALLDNGAAVAVLRHHAAWAGSLGAAGCEAHVWALAHLAATEFYSAHAADFFPSAADRERLQAVRPLAEAMLGAESDGERRRRLRQLRDQCARFGGA